MEMKKKLEIRLNVVYPGKRIEPLIKNKTNKQ